MGKRGTFIQEIRSNPQSLSRNITFAGVHFESGLSPQSQGGRPIKPRGSVMGTMGLVMGGKGVSNQDAKDSFTTDPGNTITPFASKQIESNDMCQSLS